MFVVPAETAVTKPVLLTVATPVSLDTQGLVEAAVAEPVNWVDVPTRTNVVPVIVGKAFTVTVAVVVQPLELVYVMFALPAETAVTKPVLLTVATPVLLDTQGFVEAAVPEPVN